MPHPDHDPRPPDWRAHLAAFERAWQRFSSDPSEHHYGLLRTGEEILTRALFKPGKFELGVCLATPGARDAMSEAGHVPPEFLLRHKHGDWGELGDEDKRANEAALRSGGRLLSAYRTRLDAKLWVITEWDRSATTLLLPEDY
jgi:hypothetical protein